MSRDSFAWHRPGSRSFVLLVYACLSVFLVTLTPALAAPTEEVSYTFEINSEPINRGGNRIAVVNIVVTLVYKPGIPTSDFPDIRPIVENVRTFVRTYPEPKAYFEVIAKEAAMRVLATTPAVASATIVLDVHTDETRSYKRSVRASISR